MDCEKIRDCMAEYIGQALDDNIKKELDLHIDSCESCFDEIKKLDKTTYHLECDSRSTKTPLSFLQGMEEKVIDDIKPRIKISRKVIIAMLASITAAALITALILFVPQNFKYKVYSAATFGRVYSTEYGTFGRKLNTSSTSNNIKITVTKVAADDLQTIIYLKVEGSTSETLGIANADVSINGKKGNGSNWADVYSIDSHGVQFAFAPIETDRQTLNIKINGLHELIDRNDVRINGTWSFAVPVEKLKSRVYSINKTVDLGETSIYFKNLIVGSTCTRVEYYFPDRDNVLETNLMGVEAVNGQKIYSEKGTTPGGNGQYGSIVFETIYPDNPENFKVNIKDYLVHTTLTDSIAVNVNLKGAFPVEFNYMGNTIKLDNMKVNGITAQFDLIEPDGPRNYTDLFINTDSDYFLSWDPKDYCVVDEDNNVYSYDDYIENPEKYKDKDVILYPVKTAVSVEFPSGFKDSFTFYISGSQNIVRANKIVTLK